MAEKLGVIVADLDLQIATKTTIGGTTVTLQSVLDDDGVILPNGTYFWSIDSSNSQKEHFTGTLDNATKIISGVQSISRQGVVTSGFARVHKVGALVEQTDFATLYYLNEKLKGTATLNGSSPLKYDAHPTFTDAKQLIDKKYADDLAIAGAGNADQTTQGLVEMATQSELDSGTQLGGSGAYLVPSPDIIRGKLINDYAADAGSTDAYAITTVPAITAYATGQRFSFKANTLNTGACTLNVCGLGAKTIKKNVSSDLSTGDILANQIVEVEYDGTNMQLLSKTPFTDTVSLTSGVTGVLPTANGGTGISTAVYKSGAATVSTVASSKVIAHGLGTTPVRVKITAQSSTGTATVSVMSVGTYDVTGTNQQCIYTSNDGSDTNRDASHILYLSPNTGSGITTAGTCSVDATNITIAFTNANGGQVHTLLWEVWAF